MAQKQGVFQKENSHRKRPESIRGRQSMDRTDASKRFHEDTIPGRRSGSPARPDTLRAPRRGHNQVRPGGKEKSRKRENGQKRKGYNSPEEQRESPANVTTRHKGQKKGQTGGSHRISHSVTRQLYPKKPPPRRESKGSLHERRESKRSLHDTDILCRHPGKTPGHPGDTGEKQPFQAIGRLHTTATTSTTTTHNRQRGNHDSQHTRPRQDGPRSDQGHRTRDARQEVRMGPRRTVKSRGYPTPLHPEHGETGQRDNGQSTTHMPGRRFRSVDPLSRALCSAHHGSETR